MAQQTEDDEFLDALDSHNPKATIDGKDSDDEFFDAIESEALIML